MLVLSRTVGQELIIGDNIRIRVAQSKGGRVKLVVDAPREISVRREELAPRLDDEPAAYALAFER